MKDAPEYIKLLQAVIKTNQTGDISELRARVDKLDERLKHAEVNLARHAVKIGLFASALYLIGGAIVKLIFDYVTK